MRRTIAALALTAALSACSSQGPFVLNPDIPGAIIPVNTTVDPIRATGRFSICYGFDKADKVMALAKRTCREYGLEAHFIQTELYSCRLTAPQKADFQCINPKMRWPNGAYVNPLNPKEVKAWSESRPLTPTVRSAETPD